MIDNISHHCRRLPGMSFESKDVSIPLKRLQGKTLDVEPIKKLMAPYLQQFKERGNELFNLLPPLRCYCRCAHPYPSAFFFPLPPFITAPCSQHYNSTITVRLLATNFGNFGPILIKIRWGKSSLV